MPGAERIVGALVAAGEARQAALLAQRADALAAAGQHLVRIGLVADVPDQPIFGRLEDGVEGDGELDDTEAGAKMAAGHRDGVDDLGAQLIGELAQLAAVKRADIGGGRNGVEQRRKRTVGHWRLFCRQRFRRGQPAMQPQLVCKSPADGDQLREAMSIGLRTTNTS